MDTQPQTHQGYLSFKAAAQWAGVSCDTLERWVHHGLPVHQGTARGKRLIRPSDIDSFLKRRQTVQANWGTIVDQIVQEVRG